MAGEGTGRVVRFGPFEADPRSGQLRKNGIKLKLQELPFRALAVLLERPGEIVTRDELRQKLWAKDEFVEFEHSLNTAVNKLRAALGDHADQPRYIETIPRRGYRFVGEVEGPAGGPAPPAERAGRVTRIVPWAVMGLAVAVAIVALVMWRSQSGQPSRYARPVRLTTDTGLTYQPILSRDGKFLAYASDRAGRGDLDIWAQQIGGGEPWRLTSDEANDYEPHFSPDGTRVVFRSDRDEGGVYVVDAMPGGKPRLVAKQGRRPRFSPDGQWIAYWTGAPNNLLGRVYVVPSAGGQSRDLASGTRPVWAPDSRHLLFVQAGQGPVDWTVLSIDNGETAGTGAIESMVEADLGPTVHSAFVPESWDGRSHVLFSARVGDATNVWRVPISTKTWEVAGDPEPVTSGAGVETQASASASGRLAFSSLQKNFDVWALRIDPAQTTSVVGVERLTDTAATDYRPSLSSNGKKLAFVSDRSGNPDIWMKDFDSGEEIRLTDTPEEEGSVHISPDGLRAIYSLRRDRKRTIELVSVGENLIQDVCEDCGSELAWAPDGKKLVYYTGGRGTGLHLLDLVSQKSVSYATVEAGDRRPSRPCFSPDGRWVAFHAYDRQADRRQVFIIPFRETDMNVSRNEWIAITDAMGSERGPAWSPDSNTLYYVSQRDGFGCVWSQRLDPDTKEPAGEPRGVHHVHAARNALQNENPSHVSLSAAANTIVFAMPENTGNIWMMEPVDEE